MRSKAPERPPEAHPGLHPTLLPLPRPTIRERHRARVAGDLAEAFRESSHGHHLEGDLAMHAAQTLAERHLQLGGHAGCFRTFDAASFLRWVPQESLLPREVVPPLIEAWLAFTHFLFEERRVDEVTAARLRRDLMLGEPALVRTLGARYDAMMRVLDDG